MVVPSSHVLPDRGTVRADRRPAERPLSIHAFVEKNRPFVRSARNEIAPTIWQYFLAAAIDIGVSICFRRARAG